MFLRQFIIVYQFRCERVGEAVNEKINQPCFAHDLLPLSIWVALTLEWVLVHRAFKFKDELYNFYEQLLDRYVKRQIEGILVLFSDIKQKLFQLGNCRLAELNIADFHRGGFDRHEDIVHVGLGLHDDAVLLNVVEVRVTFYFAVDLLLSLLQLRFFFANEFFFVGNKFTLGRRGVVLRY
jgi:hypothetical protein